MSNANAPADGGQGNPAPVDWAAGLNDDLRGYVQNKGFKDPSAVVDSYRNLEKLMGAPKERILRLPEKDDDADGWNAVYDRLGRPQDPNGYDIKAPEGVGDDSFATWAKGTFHELGIPKKQAEALASKWNEYVEDLAAKGGEAQQAKAAEEAQALQKKWGAAHDQHMNVARRAAREFGVESDVIDALEAKIGYSKVMELFHAIGSKLGEDSFVTGGKQSGFGALTPEAARNRIAALRTDPDFTKKYVSGDVNAREEMERLHKWAYSD